MKLHRKVFKIHAILFVLFGFFVFMGLYETTPIEMIESQITGRSPASIATVSLKSTEVLKIDCANFDQELRVPAHQVRLEGYMCDKIMNEKDVTIVNETTGKTATLFNKGKTQYMTDFIQLKDGENRISFNYKQKDQSLKTIDLMIVR